MCSRASSFSASPSTGRCGARRWRHLRPVQGHRPELQELHLLRDPEHLYEQRLDLLKEPLAERAQHIMIKVVFAARSQNAASRRWPARCISWGGPRGIAVGQQRQEHHRVVGRRARAAVYDRSAPRGPTDRGYPPQNTPVVLRQPIIERWRQEVKYVTITGDGNGSWALAHQKTDRSDPPRMKSSMLSPTGCLGTPSWEALRYYKPLSAVNSRPPAGHSLITAQSRRPPASPTRRSRSSRIALAACSSCITVVQSHLHDLNPGGPRQ